MVERLTPSWLRTPLTARWTTNGHFALFHNARNITVQPVEKIILPTGLLPISAAVNPKGTNKNMSNPVITDIKPARVELTKDEKMELSVSINHSGKLILLVEDEPSISALYNPGV